MGGFTRDRVTLATYSYLALWGWFLYSFGPTIPLLREEQGTSRAVAGLHGTALAVGAVLSAVLTVPVVRRVGRRATIVLGAGLTLAGATVLAAGPGTAWTVLGALVAGTGGALGLNATNAVLGDHHHESAAAAVSEGNAVAAGAGIVAPLALGAGIAAGLTWRAALLAVLPLAALVLLFSRRAQASPALDSVGGPRVEPGERRAPYGRTFWAAWCVLVLLIATEFSTTYWVADLLRDRTGLSAGAASAAVAAVLVGMTAGRLLAVPLTLRWRSEGLLLAAIGVAVAGWAVTWTATAPVVAVVGLGVLGLGLALHFPLSITRLMAASGGRPDAATSVASFGVGIASGLAPLALGALSDAVGPTRGFLLVPTALGLAALLLVTVARRVPAQV